MTSLSFFPDSIEEPPQFQDGKYTVPTDGIKWLITVNSKLSMTCERPASIFNVRLYLDWKVEIYKFAQFLKTFNNRHYDGFGLYHPIFSMYSNHEFWTTINQIGTVVLHTHLVKHLPNYYDGTKSLDTVLRSSPWNFYAPMKIGFFNYVNFEQLSDEEKRYPHLLTEIPSDMNTNLELDFPVTRFDVEMTNCNIICDCVYLIIQMMRLSGKIFFTKEQVEKLEEETIIQRLIAEFYKNNGEDFWLCLEKVGNLLCETYKSYSKHTYQLLTILSQSKY